MLTLCCMLCRLLDTAVDGRCNRMECVVRTTRKSHHGLYDQMENWDVKS
ncbi:hypothetical protein Hanom_Chr13g01216521 [Helianthus anomalus]